MQAVLCDGLALYNVAHMRPYAHYLASFLARLEGPGKKEAKHKERPHINDIGLAVCTMISAAFYKSMNYTAWIAWTASATRKRWGCDWLR